MSTRSNPFEDIEQFFERMSRQFEESADAWENDGPLGRWGGEEMAIDLVEHDDEFVVTIDLPGFEKDDVDVRVTDHTLRIEADREESTDEESERYLRHERRERSMSRSIRLPEEVRKEEVKARMNNGVLTVTVPKMEVEEAHSIEIE
ncbi:Hsp20/alpha crystallin family protein [Halolamina litorea]|jgi:HSP20 family protein|uniref:Archaeal heat shock protein Hsp14 n=1 Tax=Halolamina litorea TaxID=1515593 RepID=A0ABD6BV31_9EURY|nr:archaeal heat shock protein Hsp14 [Halolamina litorea]